MPLLLFRDSEGAKHGCSQDTVYVVDALVFFEKILLCKGYDSSAGGPNASIVSTTRVKWSRNELAQTLRVFASVDDIVLKN